MASSTKQGRSNSSKTEAKEEVHPLLQSHGQKILAWNDAETELAALIAKESEDEFQMTDEHKKAKLSLGAKKANRKHEIRNLELDMASEGVEYERWEEPAKPKRSRSRSTKPALTQEQLQTNLDKVYRVFSAETTDEAMKVTADARINALLKQAERAGYQIADPRKS